MSCGYRNLSCWLDQTGWSEQTVSDVQLIRFKNFTNAEIISQSQTLRTYRASYPLWKRCVDESSIRRRLNPDVVSRLNEDTVCRPAGCGKADRCWVAWRRGVAIATVDNSTRATERTVDTWCWVTIDRQSAIRAPAQWPPYSTTDLIWCVTSHPVGVRSIAINMYVCPFVCLFICLSAIVKNSGTFL